MLEFRPFFFTFTTFGQGAAAPSPCGAQRPNSVCSTSHKEKQRCEDSCAVACILWCMRRLMPSPRKR